LSQPPATASVASSSSATHDKARGLAAKDRVVVRPSSLPRLDSFNPPSRQDVATTPRA